MTAHALRSALLCSVAAIAIKYHGRRYAVGDPIGPLTAEEVDALGERLDAAATEPFVAEDPGAGNGTDPGIPQGADAPEGAPRSEGGGAAADGTAVAGDAAAAPAPGSGPGAGFGEQAPPATHAEGAGADAAGPETAGSHDGEPAAPPVSAAAEGSRANGRRGAKK